MSLARAGAAGRLADALFAVDPALSLAFTRASARAGHRLGLLGPRASDFARLFPGLSPRASSRAARGSAARTAMGTRVTRAVRQGRFEPVARLLDQAALDRFGALVGSGPPAVVASLHLGPFSALRPAFERAGVRAVFVQAGPAAAPTALTESLDIGSDQQSQARALWRLRRIAAEGASAVLMIDSGIGAETPPAACLGRRVRFSRGAYALARLAGARLITAWCRWGAGPAPILVECPIPEVPLELVRAVDPAWEQAHATSLCDAVAERIGADPASLDSHWLRLLCSAGAVQPPALAGA